MNDILKTTALIIVDMQKYYLKNNCDFYKYCISKNQEAMNYILKRCEEIVVPNIIKLQEFFRQNKSQIIYLRLCGIEPDRSDMHRFFKKSYLNAIDNGFNNLYPLCNDKDADILDEIKPLANEKVFDKTTFSAFNSTKINEYLKENKIEFLVFTGLATSQCVETTARDASDYGYSVIHIEDAQADYRDKEHVFSIINSNAVCGGWVIDTDSFIQKNQEYLKSITDEER